jgi:hypothetical protein
VLVFAAHAKPLRRCGSAGRSAVCLDRSAGRWKFAFVDERDRRLVVRHARHRHPRHRALALPATFPHRDLILFAAFAVTFRTLTIQGQTLRPLMLRLRLASDDVVEREVQSARIELADVAHHALEAHTGPEAEALRSQLHTQRAAAGDAAEGRAAALRIQSLRRLTLDRRRARLLELRRTGVIGNDAFHRLEEELDLADLDRSG